jgi:hypothetical protein
MIEGKAHILLSNSVSIADKNYHNSCVTTCQLVVSQAIGKETNVAPATANSTVLAFVNRDMQHTNPAVAIIMIANLAGWLVITLQITTGASSKNTMSGPNIARATLIVEERENI